MEGHRDCANIQREGDIQDCGNYRDIKMISYTMKIWERVIDRRLREETTIGEEQFGFMPGRGTIDAIFAARQVIEKHREMQKELHLVFIDLEKAYDSQDTTTRSLEVFERAGCSRKVCAPREYYQYSELGISCDDGAVLNCDIR